VLELSDGETEDAEDSEAEALEVSCLFTIVGCIIGTERKYE
jgi:hypothetical protein